MKVIQELLGRSDISITLSLYSHLMPSMQQDVTDKWDGEFKDDDEEERYILLSCIFCSHLTIV